MCHLLRGLKHHLQAVKHEVYGNRERDDPHGVHRQPEQRTSEDAKDRRGDQALAGAELAAIEVKDEDLAMGSMMTNRDEGLLHDVSPSGRTRPGRRP
jgi:hypothetical protein